MRSSDTRVRRTLRGFADALGIKRSRSRMLRNVPPDFDDQTVRVLRAVDGLTMTGPERIEALVTAVRYVVSNDIDGHFVECGVWRGGSSMAVALTLAQLEDTQRRLYLYDTFEGMSAPTAMDVEITGKTAAQTFAERRLAEDSSAWCRSSLEEVKHNLATTGYPADRLHFIKGKVEDTIPAQVPSGPIAILRLDTDWYESTRHELEHLYPRLAQGGILIVDDYGHWAGARAAVDEYVEKHGLRILLSRIDYTARIAVKQ